MSTSSHPILLAALDLDGTLLNSNGEVSPCTQKVLSEASDRGVVVIPATGRPLASLPPVVAKQPWVHYALTSNGAAVWDLGGDPLGCVYSRYANAAEHETSQPECIVRRCFPVEKAREVYEAFHGLPGGLNIFSDGRALRDTAQQRFFDERFARLAAVKGTEAIQPNDGRFTILRDQSEWMSRHAHEVEKFCMFFHSVKEAQQYLPRFTAIEGVEVVQGAPDNIEVTAAGQTEPTRLTISANPITVASFDVTESDAGTLDVSWTFDGTAPADGWLLVYSLNNSETSSVVKCSEPKGSISPMIPDTTYHLTLQLSNDTSIFNSSTSYTTTAAEPFSTQGLSCLLYTSDAADE